MGSTKRKFFYKIAVYSASDHIAVLNQCQMQKCKGLIRSLHIHHHREYSPLGGILSTTSSWYPSFIFLC